MSISVGLGLRANRTIGRAYRFQYLLRQRLAAAAVTPPPNPPPGLPLRPARVLTVLTGLLGDTVMCTPVLRELRRERSQDFITVLGRQRNIELLRDCPWVDEFHVSESDPFSLRQRKDVAALRRWLSAGRFDAAIILLGEQYASLVRDAGIPIRVGPGQSILASCLTHPYRDATPRSWGPAERLNALRALQLGVRDGSPELAVSDPTRARASDRLRTAGVPDGSRYLVAHLWGSETRQWWRAGAAAPFFKRLALRTGCAIVAVGGPETAAAELPALPGVIDTRGQLSVTELVGVIAGARMVISTDSGPFHIAGALRRPTVGVFRGRRPEHASRYSTAAVVFGHDDECQDQCAWDRCAASPCRQMASVDQASVLRAVENILPAAGRI